MSTGLTPSWKLFRLCCIIHMVLVALQLMLGVSGLFYRSKIIFPLTEMLAYGVIFIFIYMGLSLLNYNYPDQPLSPRQRRNFNWLFLVNFLLVAYLFGQLIVEWRRVIPWITLVEGSFRDYLSLLTMLIMNFVIFILHIVFIAGMYQLRRVIYQNTMNNWYSQFDEEKKS
jgi:hypothetical protein